MLRGFAHVKRFAETDDVLQNSLLRLLRSLQEVQPRDMRQFFGLATVQIRRELIDLARHFYGPHGDGAITPARRPPPRMHRPARHEPIDLSHDPSMLAEWCELHQQIERLPTDAARNGGVDLLSRAATDRGRRVARGVGAATVQRRWQNALLKLHQILQ